MNNKKKVNVAPKTVRFISAWEAREKAITVIDEDSIDLYMSNDEIGVIINSVIDFSFVKDQAAFLFGSSPDILIFRASFDCFVKVPNNDDDNKDIRELLFKSRFASFCNASKPFCSKTESGIPVYLDALSMISQMIDAEIESEDGFRDNSLSNLDGETISIRDVKEVEKQTTESLVLPCTCINEIQKVVDTVINEQGGYVYARFRSGNNQLYNFDFVMISNRFFMIVYAGFSGNWLADEEAFNGEPPLWFSEVDHRVSPVFQAMKSCAFFQHSLQDITIDSIVVIPQDCTIINEEDMRECWQEQCQTVIVLTKKEDKMSLKSLNEYIVSLPPTSPQAQQLDIDEVNKISNSFIENYIAPF